MAPYLLHVYYGQGTCLVQLSQTGSLPDVTLSPMTKVGQGSGNCNSRSKERKAIGSTRQDRACGRSGVLFQIRLADVELECARGTV